MSEPERILAIDCATHFGWAFGSPGEKPVSGSRYFTKSGEAPSGGSISNGAKFWNAICYAREAVEEFKPTVIYCEAPIAPNAKSGQTQTSTFEVLYGLPAALRGAFYGFGCHRWEWAFPSSVRKKFIGKGGLPGDEAKPIVWRKCLNLGWISPSDDDLSHDRTDALAVWYFGCLSEDPQGSQPIDDLFVKADQRKRAAEAAAAAAVQSQSIERF